MRYSAIQQKGFMPVFLLLILALITVAGISYYSFKNSHIKSSPYNSLNPSPITSKIGETTDWKTYTNEGNDFSFQYPENITVNDDVSSLTLSWKDDKNPLLQGYLYIPIAQREKDFFYGGDYKDILPNLRKLEVGELYKFKFGATSWTQEIIRQPDREIAGIQSYVYYSDVAWERPGPWTVIDIPLKSGNQIIEISFNEKSSYDFKNTFDQILSTFKFTNTETSTKSKDCVAATKCEGDKPCMANPASLFCECMGGISQTKENASGQYGICLVDGKEYDEWEYYRSNSGL